MIVELTEQEFKTKAEKLLQKIFTNYNPYGQPFSLNVEEKLIIHHFKYMMEPPLLNAITYAAEQCGDKGFYISILTRTKMTEDRLSWTDERFHWYVPLADINTYDSLDEFFIPPDHIAIFSENGLWAILGSDEHFGLLSGTATFMAAVRKQLPDIDKQVEGFFEEWNYNKQAFKSITHWIPNLLINVYGEEKAKELLTKFNLP